MTHLTSVSQQILLYSICFFVFYSNKPFKIFIYILCLLTQPDCIIPTLGYLAFLIPMVWVSLECFEGFSMVADF